MIVSLLILSGAVKEGVACALSGTESQPNTVHLQEDPGVYAAMEQLLVGMNIGRVQHGILCDYTTAIHVLHSASCQEAQAKPSSNSGARTSQEVSDSSEGGKYACSNAEQWAPEIITVRVVA